MYNSDPISLYVMLSPPYLWLPSVIIQHYYGTIAYVPYAVPLIPMTYSFHNWKPVSPTPLYSLFGIPSKHCMDESVGRREILLVSKKFGIYRFVPGISNSPHPMRTFGLSFPHGCLLYCIHNPTAQCILRST